MSRQILLQASSSCGRVTAKSADLDIFNPLYSRAVNAGEILQCLAGAKVQQLWKQ